MKISYDDWLKAKGLFLLASEANRKAQDYGRALESHLGVEMDRLGGHISDAIWGGRDFDEALRLEGIEIEPQPETEPRNES